ncbi:hypothetical protein [Crocosphaera sp. XPORK-15E]|uniref:hypothetical protein n=1 Tax=Crocosphaera sp. XPORK-15E TaxID=3110247 RepID=UPI002B1FACC1|nr:hypothetical protein [Crocosphaera sp. XPORK-15E]MEA5537255.1 hypothetical protein [Crocosphaera sp. XPORK-15E]
MLILLDENLLSKKLKQPFLAQDHSVLNVYDVGWRGLKDKEILDLAENYPFDAFMTADKNLPYQQNLATRSIRVALPISWCKMYNKLQYLRWWVTTRIKTY